MRNWTLFCALALGVAASRVILCFSSSSPEPDSLAMVAGLTMALRGDIPFREAFLYGREGSPGIYLVGRYLYPLLFRNPSHLLSFLTSVTVIASVAMVVPLLTLAQRFLSRGLAATVVLIALLTPAVWELSTYFHPEILAAALVLFAIAVGTRTDGRPAGTLRTLAAVLLGASAMLMRVHVLFVLPGLAVAALFSRQRARNLGAIAGALALGILAYVTLQKAVSTAQPSDAGFSGYVSMILNMYTHGFSPRALPKSIVWAVFGMGTASVAALVAGWRPSTLRKPAVLVGLAWLVPALLFWLPQPTPIVRHYVLPSFGLVLALAVVLAGQGRAMVLAAIVLVSNIAVPEVIYRSYNASHPTGQKTPHGAVVYNHQWMAQRIARFDELSDGVMGAVASPGCTGVLVFAQWEGLAHVIYDIAHETPGFHPTEKGSFYDSVQQRSYRSGDREFHFIHYRYFEDPDLQRLGLQEIDARINEGYAVFVPHELAEGPLAGMLRAPGMHVY